MDLAELPEREIERFGGHVSVIFKDRQWTNLDMRRDSTDEKYLGAFQGHFRLRDNRGMGADRGGRQ